jgi:hypothetical protein
VSRSPRTTSSPHCSSASHPTGHIFAEEGWRFEWTYHLGPVNIAHGPTPVDLFLGTPNRDVSELTHLR